MKDRIFKKEIQILTMSTFWHTDNYKAYQLVVEALLRVALERGLTKLLIHSHTLKPCYSVNSSQIARAPQIRETILTGVDPDYGICQRYSWAMCSSGWLHKGELQKDENCDVKLPYCSFKKILNC